MKRQISILMSLLLSIMLFSACGSVGGSSSAPSSITSTETTPATEPAADTIPDGALLIKEQGNFSVGGTVVTSEGEFDPMQPWTVPQGGQTKPDMATMRTYPIRFLLTQTNTPWFSFTVPDNQDGAGKRRLTGGKVSQTSF